MVDFGVNKTKKVKETSYTVHDVFAGDLPDPTLTGRFAGEANKPYFNALLKGQARFSGARRRKKHLTTDELAENRALNRKLFAKYIVTGWADMVDKDGNPVPFSDRNAYEFFCAIEDADFDAVCDHFENPASFDADDEFEDDDVVFGEDAQELGKS